MTDRAADRTSGRGRSPAGAAALVATVTVLVSVALTLLHVPSAVLFGALLGGMAHALTSPTPLALPPWCFRVGQGLVGVTIGSLVSVAALSAMGGSLVAILLVTAGTVALSLAAGRVLSLRQDVSRVTGAFAMIAGGASGVVAVARDLGADDRVVTIVQYLRVFVVLVTMPLVTAVVFHPAHGVGTFRVAGGSVAADLVYTAVAVVLGLLVARVVPVSTATLLGPLAVAVALTATGWLGTPTVPVPLQWVAYAVIGVQVGLRFTRESLVSIARMLPVVTVIIVAMVGATALMGALLARLTPVDGLTAYLATTPGGLFAVLATAADSGSDVTYVMAVQLLRLLVILALTPLLARYLRARPGRPHDAS
jgi:membrane AbrB-like protein